jgi:hypothetical protein
MDKGLGPTSSNPSRRENYENKSVCVFLILERVLLILIMDEPVTKLDLTPKSYSRKISFGAPSVF